MAGIPSAALKFYTASSGGTEVTGGTSAGATIYPRIPSSFTENLTGSNKTISFPYKGRIALTGTKTFVCGADSDIFTVSLPEYGNIPADEDLSVGWTGTGTANESDGAAYQKIISIPKGSGNISITFYTNSQYVTGNATGHNGATFASHTMDGVSVGEEPANSQTVNDIGRVVKYAIVLTYGITANPTIAQRTVLSYVYEVTAGTYTYTFQQISGDANLALSVSSANVDKTTGLSSTSVTVNANTNWTIS